MTRLRSAQEYELGDAPETINTIRWRAAAKTRRNGAFWTR